MIIKEIVVYVWFGLLIIIGFFFFGVGLGFEKIMVEIGLGWIFEFFGLCYCWGKFVYGSLVGILFNLRCL